MGGGPHSKSEERHGAELTPVSETTEGQDCGGEGLGRGGVVEGQIRYILPKI